jgi:SseB protein N-terminal domain
MNRPDNVSLRRAVAHFQEARDQASFFDVLRECLQGDLLVGNVVSQVTEQEPPVDSSAKLPLYGKRAVVKKTLYVFTRVEEAVKVDADTAASVTARPAVEVLEQFRDEGLDFVCIDPAGPRCLISADNVETMLRVPRNVPVKTALAIEVPGKRRLAVRRALEMGGLLLQVVRWNSEGQYEHRTTFLPDGRTAALAFTSELEIKVRYESGDFIESPVERIVKAVLAGEDSGLVINPGGPWIALDADELRGLRINK